jgi:hypothetical protein
LWFSFWSCSRVWLCTHLRRDSVLTKASLTLESCSRQHGYKENTWSRDEAFLFRRRPRPSIPSFSAVGLGRDKPAESPSYDPTSLQLLHAADATFLPCGSKEGAVPSEEPYAGARLSHCNWITRFPRGVGYGEHAFSGRHLARQAETRRRPVKQSPVACLPLLVALR